MTAGATAGATAGGPATGRTPGTLTVRNLVVSYGGVRALHGIDLEVPAGGVLALLGNNGAGKTSTLTAVAGVVRPDSGRVLLDGRDVTGWRPDRLVRCGLSLTPEGRRVFARVTVRDHLRLGGWARRGDRGTAERRIAEMFELFPALASRQRQLAGTLSGGQQQQLALARSLMSEPRVLLLDEPSLGLAPQMIDVVFAALHRLRERGVTTVLVEQNARRAVELADEVVVLAAGRVVAARPAAGFFDLAELRDIYLGHQPEARHPGRTP